MAKKGMNVRDLARELGITSRELLSRCRAHQLPIQNSITKLSAAMEEQIRKLVATPPDTPV